MLKHLGFIPFLLSSVTTQSKEVRQVVAFELELFTIKSLFGLSLNSIIMDNPNYKNILLVGGLNEVVPNNSGKFNTNLF